MSDAIQELLVAARRNQILDAATQVFAERGFHTATIKDIARAAGIGDGTIYNYFASKGDLLLGILDRLNETEQRAPQFAVGAEGDFRSFFTAYLRHRLEVIWRHQDVLRAIMPEILANAELRERYYAQMIVPTTAIGEAFLEAKVQDGTLRPLDVPLLTRALGAAVSGLMLMRLLGDEMVAERAEELPDLLANMILDGILGADDA